MQMLYMQTTKGVLKLVGNNCVLKYAFSISKLQDLIGFENWGRVRTVWTKIRGDKR